MIKRIGEKLAEGMGVIGGIHGLLETFGKFNESLPPIIKQRLPGFLNLSLVDEQIFNSVLGQIDVKKQVIITNFLKEKCKDYERNRFTNIVAGMEVIEEGKKEETANSFDDNGKKVTKKTIESGRKNDTRKKFLESFADIITNEFDGNLDKAYDFCIGGRMIIPDPIHQQALRAFSEGMGWLKKQQLKNSADLENSTMSLREKAKSYREKYDKKYAGRNKS